MLLLREWGPSLVAILAGGLGAWGWLHSWPPPRVLVFFAVGACVVFASLALRCAPRSSPHG